eukprot:5397429-Pleurochrysis_carterae.AAC.1
MHARDAHPLGALSHLVHAPSNARRTRGLRVTLRFSRRFARGGMRGRANRISEVWGDGTQEL